MARKLSSRGEEQASYFILALPAVILYIAVVGFPTIFSIWLSLTNYKGGQLFGNPDVKIVGLESYITVFTSSTFWMALKNNLWIVLISVFGQIPLGFILAYILSRKLVKGVDFFQTVIYLPNIITAVVIGILMRSFFLDNNSVWMQIVHVFDKTATVDFTSSPMTPVLIVMLWMYTGMYVIIFLAAIAGIDDSVIEAAKIDGAGEVKILTHIMIPAMTGIIVTSAILAISGSLKSYDLLWVMTQGGPADRTSVLSIYMYKSAFQGSSNFPLANAISTIMVLISFILIALTKFAEKTFGSTD
ncbi:MAG: sugar ABC transporter permease [Spirochaetaceae bacterium]|jgi:raffinose/stachyose/melibiose transport system permease protein|nr:sugar ABC transporter permease [Spirochaetaceae bacterium]